MVNGAENVAVGEAYTRSNKGSVVNMMPTFNTPAYRTLCVKDWLKMRDLNIAYQLRERFECTNMIITFFLTELILLCVSNNTMHNIGHEAKHLFTVGPLTAAMRGFEKSISSET